MTYVDAPCCLCPRCSGEPWFSVVPPPPCPNTARWPAPGTFYVDPSPRLSSEDVEAIAQRVAELLRPAAVDDHPPRGHERE